MRLAVVIPFYNAVDWLRICVDSLLQSSLLPESIYIVNNSTIQVDLSGFAVKDRVYILEDNPAIGFGRANNLGTQAAINTGAEVVVILNQDAQVHEKALERLADALLNHPEVAIAAPLVFNYDADWKRIDDTYLKMYLTPVPDLLSDFICNNPLKPVYPLKHAVSGSCMAIRSSVIQTLGLFEPAISMYGEDVDLFQRYACYGHQTVLVPSSKVAHKHGHASSEGRELRKIRTLIHRHTPYALWKNPVKPLLKRVTSILSFLAADYAGALAKGKIATILAFLWTDGSLPFRLISINSRRNPEVLKKAIFEQCLKDKKN
ncbi:MAG: glycosyltransferase family 2 protein [Saprospiraceae bacterium]|nr:glycosyltransferase family 2 protein [Saprospiraceae bacterium]